MYNVVNVMNANDANKFHNIHMASKSFRLAKTNAMVIYMCQICCVISIFFFSVTLWVLSFVFSRIVCISNKLLSDTNFCDFASFSFSPFTLISLKFSLIDANRYRILLPSKIRLVCAPKRLTCTCIKNIFIVLLYVYVKCVSISLGFGRAKKKQFRKSVSHGVCRVYELCAYGVASILRVYVCDGKTTGKKRIQHLLYVLVGQYEWR